jgi:amide synthase
MLDVGQYLAAIGYHGSVEPSLETLRGLQECHVRAVPYHCLPYADPAALLAYAGFDLNQSFQHSIASRAGGNCFQLNEPFRQLLEQLGFTAYRLAASTLLPSGQFGLDTEHIAIGVDLDGDQWLVDVGFGGAISIWPIRIVSGVVQAQHGIEHRIAHDGQWWILERKSPVKGWMMAYRFKAESRQPSDFFHLQSADFAAARLGEIAEILNELPTANLRIMGRMLGNSAIIMAGRRFTRYDASEEVARTVIDKGDYEQLASLILDPELTDAERTEQLRKIQP